MALAEAVFGTPLVLPHPYLSSPELSPTSEFLGKITHNQASTPPPSLLPDLLAPDLMFNGFAHRRPLEQFYPGLFWVVSASLQHFVVQLGNVAQGAIPVLSFLHSESFFIILLKHLSQ